MIPADGVEKSGPALPYPSTITVSGFTKATIADVNLTLNDYSHTFTPDVDVLLVAPGGGNATVMSDVGIFLDASPASHITLTLDDEAPSPLPIGAPPTSGTFQPLDAFGISDKLLDFPAPAPAPSGNAALAAFDGIDPNGEWQLFVLDDTSADNGAIAGGWSPHRTVITRIGTSRALTVRSVMRPPGSARPMAPVPVTAAVVPQAL